MTTLRVPELTMDPLQRAAAEAEEGPLVILGGPGTGKTHTIIARVALLLKGGASPHTIACLTFNSQGAEDLRRQMEDTPPTAKFATHIFIGTIHHYASFYLRRAGAASLGISPQFTIWDKQQAIEVITEMVDQEGSKGKNTPPAEISEILDWNGKNQTKTPEETDPAREAKWLDIIQEYTQEKRRQNTLDLDDLIPLAALAMERDPATRAVWNRTRSRHLLIDEFQDVTPRQHHLISLMTGPTRSITVAADPNQSIYRWRGADPRLLEQFRLDHGANLNVRMLQINHRGTRTMSNVATMLTASDKMPGLGHDYQSAIRIEGPKPTLTEFEAGPEVMDRHILDSARQLTEQGYRWEDMACIYRTHGTVNRMVTQLSSENIPHTILGETHQDRDSNARCITAILALTLNPTDRKAFTTATSLEVQNKNRQLNRELAGRIAAIAKARHTNLIVTAEAYIEKLQPGSPAHRALQYVTGAWHELNQMLDEPDTQPYDLCLRANSLLQQAQHAGPAPLQEPQTFRLLGLTQATPQMGKESPREFLSRFLELQASSLQPEHRSTENDDPLTRQQGMTLATIHAAKGKQWKIVWVADANDNNLPKLHWGHDDTDMREEERVFYVAATRATDQLHFCCSIHAEKGHDPEASPFLDVLGDLLERRVVRRARGSDSEEDEELPDSEPEEDEQQPDSDPEPEEEPEPEPEPEPDLED